MVNPYLQVQRIAEDMRTNNHAQHGNRRPPTGYNSSGNKIEDSLIGFGRWFLFCQRCRHGGHTTCVSSWFEHHQHRSEKSEVRYLIKISVFSFFYLTNISQMYCFPIDNKQNQGDVRIKTICGVNGCNCECQWMS